MDMHKRSYLVPTIIAFWLVLAFLFIASNATASMEIVGKYIITLGQVIFDFVAFWMLLDIFMQSKKGFKFAPFCFMVAVLFLVLADFFYHGLLTVGWFSFTLSTQHLYYDLPLTGFFAFMLLGWSRIVATNKSEGGAYKLFTVLVLLTSLLLVWMFFHAVTAKVPHLSIVGVYLTTQTILQALGIMFALVTMARVAQTCLHFIVVGYLMITVSDIVINARFQAGAVQMPGPELLWMLGSMLIAVGAYVRVKELMLMKSRI